MKKFWLIIPTYNESGNITELLKRLRCVSQDMNILVVDDNSPDQTADVVRQLQIKDRFLHLIVRPNKQGLGSAYRMGFDYALNKEAQVVGQMDADLSHRPEDVPKLLNKLDSGYEVVIGSRRCLEGRIVGWGWYRKLASWLANFLARLVLGLKTKDVTAGFRLYTRSALQKINWRSVKSNGYAWQEEMIFLAEQAGLKIVEAPVVFVDRQKGKSKLGWGEVYLFFQIIVHLRINKNKTPA